MRTIRSRTCMLVAATVVVTALNRDVSAQEMTLSTSVANPGQIVTATVKNDGKSSIFHAVGCEIRILRDGGELVTPTMIPPQVCDGIAILAPGATANFQITAPSKAGHYTVLFVYGTRAVARLTVGRPPRAPQQISIYPTGVQWPQHAHEINFSDPSTTTWEIANVGPGVHTLDANARVELYTPGGGTRLNTVSLAGQVVRPGKVQTFELPVAFVTPGPYTVRAFHQDPALQREVLTRSGIRDQSSTVELHMLDGHEINPLTTGQIEMAVTASDPSAPGPGPFYALLIGFAPGTTPLPGGAVLPLTFDALTVASFTGLGGLLQNNTGQINNIYPTGFFGLLGTADAIRLFHPNLPGASGVVVRAAALTVDTTFVKWDASQPEEIELR